MIPRLDQVIHRCFVKRKQLCDIPDRVGICPQLFTGRRAVYFDMLDLIGVPFLEAVDHDPHFPVDQDRFEAVLMYQPVEVRFPKTKHFPHFCDGHCGFLLFLRHLAPPLIKCYIQALRPGYKLSILFRNC